MIELEKEIWVSINGTNGTHDISNLGRIRSNIYSTNTGYKFRDTPKILSPYITPKGYVRITMTINGKQSPYYVHRLVGEHFVSNPNNYKEINHKKGLKWDNRASELEWCDRAYNNKHAFDILGRTPVGLGKQYGNKEINQFDVTGKLIKIWKSIKQAADELSINRNTIGANLNGRTNSAGGFIWKFKNS